MLLHNKYTVYNICTDPVTLFICSSFILSRWYQHFRKQFCCFNLLHSAGSRNYIQQTLALYIVTVFLCSMTNWGWSTGALHHVLRKSTPTILLVSHLVKTKKVINTCTWMNKHCIFFNFNNFRTIKSYGWGDMSVQFLPCNQRVMASKSNPRHCSNLWQVVRP